MLFLDLPPMAVVDYKSTHLEQLHMQNQTNIAMSEPVDRQKVKRLELYHKAYKSEAVNPSEITPLKDVFYSGNEEMMDIGKDLVAQGKVACLVVAGGQGTRLGFAHAKGMFPVSVVKEKSLFQIFSEKVAACGRLVGRELPIAIMTSPINDAEVKQFFKENEFFGLKPEQVKFFSQEMLPFLDEGGKIFYQEPGVLAEGPDGNGASLEHLVTADFYQSWKSQGIEQLVFIQVDNPLADPYDFELIGFHHSHKNQVSIKATNRIDPNEKVGVIVQAKDKVKVVEYIELDEEQKQAVLPSGELVFQSANLSMFCFNLNFVEESVKSGKAFPLHQAHKKASKWNTKIKKQEPIMAYKYEKFIFDILEQAEAGRVKTLLYPREICFSPLKNAEGKDSLESVHSALLKRDKQIFYQLTGRTVSYKEFELSQDFYYPTEDLISYYQNLEKLDSNYLQAEK